MILPAAIIRQPLSFSCPAFRRERLISHIVRILAQDSLPPSEASSMRGRLFYYCYWHQEARSYLVYLARRQCADDSGIGQRSGKKVVGRHLDIEAAHGGHAWPLTEELRISFCLLLDLLRSASFQGGVLPQKYANRPKALVYTDGSPSDMERGIGGVVSGRHLQTSFFAQDIEDDHFYPHIAVVEMRAFLRALHLYGEQLRGRAIIFFVDNTHSLGCLLKRSASLEGEPAQHRHRDANSAITNAAIRYPYGVKTYVEFEQLDESIKLSMYSLARCLERGHTLRSACIVGICQHQLQCG